jgi:hypothetical protein
MSYSHYFHSDIMYTLAFHAQSESSKEVAKRKAFHTEIFKLAPTTWDDLSSKIRVMIKKAYPDTTKYDFHLHYKIPNKGGGLVNLEAEGFPFMLERVAKQKPSVVLCVSAIPKVCMLSDSRWTAFLMSFFSTGTRLAG